MNDNTDRKPWDRLPEETDSQWLGFVCYLELGPGRSQEKAWVEYRVRKGLKAGNPVNGTFKEWMGIHKWTARARAFDAHEIENWRAKAAQKREEARMVLAENAPAAARALAVFARGQRLPNQSVESPVARAAQRDLLKMAGADVPQRVELTGSRDMPVVIESLGLDEKTPAELLALYRAMISGKTEDDDE